MKYCKELTKEISELLTAGNNRTDTCLLAGISYETFTVWMKKVEFSEAIKRAEAEFKQRNILLIQSAAIKTWQAAAWLLERKYRDEFALRTEPAGKSKEDLGKESLEAALKVLKIIEEASRNATNSRTNPSGDAIGLGNGPPGLQAESSAAPGL